MCVSGNCPFCNLGLNSRTRYYVHRRECAFNPANGGSSKGSSARNNMEQDSPTEIQGTSRSPPPKPRVIRQRSSEDRTSGGAAAPAGKPFMYRSLTEPAETRAAVVHDDEDPNDDSDDHEDDELMTTNAGKFATTALTCTVRQKKAIQQQRVKYELARAYSSPLVLRLLLRFAPKRSHVRSAYANNGSLRSHRGKLTIFPLCAWLWLPVVFRSVQLQSSSIRASAAWLQRREVSMPSRQSWWANLPREGLHSALLLPLLTVCFSCSVCCQCSAFFLFSQRYHKRTCGGIL